MNLVAHYFKGGSNKVYLVSLKREGASFLVVAKWGRVNSKLQSQVKGTFDTYKRAFSEAGVLFRTKTVKGYEHIESRFYSGTLKMGNTWLREYLEEDVDWSDSYDSPAASRKPMIPVTVVPRDTREFEVECLMNTGLEDSFDEGLTFVAERHSDPDMLWVWDKCAERKACFADRFKVV